MTNVNGFKFNKVGELVEEPSTYDWHDLQATYSVLIKEGEYIKASRISHLSNVHYPGVVTPLFLNEF